MKYTAEGTYNRHFQMTNENGVACGRLDYDSWFTTAATIDQLAGGGEYHFRKGNFWHTTTELVLGDNVICTFSFNWKGQIVIALADGRSFLQKLSGLMASRYEMVDSNGLVILYMHQDFTFPKLSFNYTAEVHINTTGLPDELLVLLNIYCANYRRHFSAA